MKELVEKALKKEKTPISLEKLYEKIEKILKKENEDFCCLNSEQKLEIVGILEEGVVNRDFIKTPNGNYLHILKSNFRCGKFVGTRKGDGFVNVFYSYVDKDGKRVLKSEKYSVSVNDANGAIDGDEVFIELTGKGNECRICEILNRDLENITGEVYSIGSNFYVKPIDKKKQGLVICLNSPALDGQRVSVKLLSQQSNNYYLGEITRVFNHKDDPAEDILWEAFKCGIDDQFSDDSKTQVSFIPQKVLDVDRIGREDLTDWEVFTIDGDDTKDIDDALSCKVLPNGNYLVGVHIADVSHYVKKGSPLDKDAYKRGTSYYLGGKVIPMLPHELSNGICSLNPGVERLAMSCIMEITPDGCVKRHYIKRTIIKSSLKMTYSKVNQLLKTGVIPEGYEEHADTLKNLNKLAIALRNRRLANFALEFDRPELKLIYGEDGSVVDFSLKHSDVAENLIEEFMLIANETVDRHIVNSGYPCLHRVHDSPNPEKLEDFFKLLAAVNLPYTKHSYLECIDFPKYLQDLGEHIKKESKLSGMLSLNLVKCMSRAKYSPINIGHSGLAKTHYCHFTSPIRRYPDLTIHRIVDDIIDDNLSQDDWREELPDIGTQSSKMERVSDDAEDIVLRMKCSEYMEKHIGEEYEGTVIGISDRTLLIQLDNMIEGRVKVKSLAGPYTYNPETFSLLSVDGNENYYIGDRLRVKVHSASKEDKTIDFEIVEKIDENKIVDKNGTNKALKIKAKRLKKDGTQFN